MMTRSIIGRMLVYVLVLGTGTSTVHAQSAADQVVRKNLVYLTLVGAPTEGNLIGQPDGVQSQATGFFIGNEGFILTSAHFYDPAWAVKAENVVVEAQLSGPGGTKFPVFFVSNLPDVDLVLLRATIPFGVTPPPGLATGNTAGLNPADDPMLMTSGLNDEDYDKTEGVLLERGNRTVPFAWTIKMTVGGGQSGSPVYIVNGQGNVEVIGVVKASTGQNKDRTLIVPIDYALPLIGHLKIEELQGQVAGLSKKLDDLITFVGATTPDELPLNLRVNRVAANVNEIGKYFTWSAESDRNGGITIRYDKLFAGGPQVERIDVQLTPYTRTYTDRTRKEIYVAQGTVLTITPDGSNMFTPSSVDPEGRWGEFLIPGVQNRLSTMLSLNSLATGGKDPFRDLELVIVPTVDGSALPEKKLSVVPNYDWD